MAPKRPPVLISVLAPRLLKWMSKSNAAIYRATDGRVGGHELGLPLCLLTTTGRKSGLSRTSPLIFMADGARVVLVASQGGLPTHPMWFLNLCANPEVHVQIRAQTHTMRARVADDAERAQLWPRLIAHNPRWARYQSRTDRVIPVVVCEPAWRAAGSSLTARRKAPSRHAGKASRPAIAVSPSTEIVQGGHRGIDVNLSGIAGVKTEADCFRRRRD